MQTITLIPGIERDDKGVPVLLKQFLKLGRKLISFKVDRSFSNVQDGLILVYLLESDERLLSKYMGEQGLKVFQDYQSDRDKNHCGYLDSKVA